MPSLQGLRLARCLGPWLAATLALGCGGARLAESAVAGEDDGEGEPAVEQGPAVRPGVLRLAEGVRQLEPACNEGDADDDCDGLDDDCDGIIDEGCGLEGGEVQVVAAWATGADIDLYVTEPDGDTLSFQRMSTLAGGEVDRAGRGDCGDGTEPARIENLVWNGRVLRGPYRVLLHYWGECQSLAGPTEVTVSMSVGGRPMGSIRHVMSPNELFEIGTFEVQ